VGSRERSASRVRCECTLAAISRRPRPSPTVAGGIGSAKVDRFSLEVSITCHPRAISPPVLVRTLYLSVSLHVCSTPSICSSPSCSNRSNPGHRPTVRLDTRDSHSAPRPSAVLPLHPSRLSSTMSLNAHKLGDMSLPLAPGGLHSSLAGGDEPRTKVRTGRNSAQSAARAERDA
jgi:hypothetical protein